MKLLTAADFLKLPPSKRRTVMLKVAEDAVKMQREVVRKAERIKKLAKKK